MSNQIKAADLGGWMASMRAAVFDAITAGDMVDITKGIVAKAKKGDIRAAEFLFRYVVGSPAINVRQQHTVSHEPAAPPPRVLDVVAMPSGPESASALRPTRRTDPSPDEIAAETNRIKAAHLQAMREGKEATR